MLFAVWGMDGGTVAAVRGERIGVGVDGRGRWIRNY